VQRLRTLAKGWEDAARTTAAQALALQRTVDAALEQLVSRVAVVEKGSVLLVRAHAAAGAAAAELQRSGKLAQRSTHQPLLNMCRLQHHSAAQIHHNFQ
jgi:uncharacterized protein